MHIGPNIKVNHAISYTTAVPEKKTVTVVSALRTTTKSSAKATATSSKPSVPRQPSIKPVASTHLTKEGKLTTEEKQCRIESGACFYCSEVSHLAIQCTKKTSQPHAHAVDSVSTASGSSSVKEVVPVPWQTAHASVVVLNELDDLGNS